MGLTIKGTFLKGRQANKTQNSAQFNKHLLTILLSSKAVQVRAHNLITWSLPGLRNDMERKMGKHLKTDVPQMSMLTSPRGKF